MLCAKCQKNEATIHVTTVVGTQHEMVDFCGNCAPPSLGALDHKGAMAEARSMLEEKCELCGAQAYAHLEFAGSEAIYLCFGCESERMSIVMESLKTERPDLARTKDAGSIYADPVSSRRSIQLLKERRREDGRDKQS